MCAMSSRRPKRASYELTASPTESHPGGSEVAMSCKAIHLDQFAPLRDVNYLKPMHMEALNRKWLAAHQRRLNERKREQTLLGVLAKLALTNLPTKAQLNRRAAVHFVASITLHSVPAQL